MTSALLVFKGLPAATHLIQMMSSLSSSADFVSDLSFLHAAKVSSPVCELAFCHFGPKLWTSLLLDLRTAHFFSI